MMESTGRSTVPAASASPRSVLVAEDNAVNRLVARGVLEGLGYGVVFANNGLEAVAAMTARARPVRRGADGLPDAPAGRLRGHPGHPQAASHGYPGTRHRADRYGLRRVREQLLRGSGHGRLHAQASRLRAARRRSCSVGRWRRPQQVPEVLAVDSPGLLDVGPGPDAAGPRDRSRVRSSRRAARASCRGCQLTWQSIEHGASATAEHRSLFTSAHALEGERPESRRRRGRPVVPAPRGSGASAATSTTATELASTLEQRLDLTRTALAAA